MFQKTLVLCQILALFFLPSLVQAQTAFTDMRVDYSFGEVIYLEASLLSDQPVFQGLVFLKVLDTGKQFVKPTMIVPVNDTQYQLSYLADLAELSLPAFSKIEYHFQVMLENGEVIHSPTKQFDYFDNRFDWNQINQLPFQVNWFLGDQSFAQRILNAAIEGTRHIERILPISRPEQILIYVYPGTTEMQAALAPFNQDWVAGHVIVRAARIIVSLPSDIASQNLIDQRIPHELMHVYLSDMLGDRYENLPIWLIEGLASFAELSPNPDYEIILQEAYRTNQLMPLASLCESFPSNAVDALGAYAQSTSIVSYLFDEYGREGIEKLVNQYAEGADCEEGVQLALGTGLSQLERRWRQDQFGENIILVSLVQVLPWFILFVIITIVPLGLWIFWFRKKRQLPNSGY